jgi:hypothetical protein
VALLALSCGGCSELVVRSGLPAGSVANGYDARWHDSFFFGTVEPSPIAPAASLCPRGWSELRISASFEEALLQWSTLGIYTPSEVTLVCAPPPGVYLGAPAEAPLVPMCR